MRQRFFLFCLPPDRAAAVDGAAPGHSDVVQVITATSGTASATRALEFVATVPTTVDVQPSAFTIATGQSATLTAVVRDVTGNLVKNRTVVFTLNDVTGGQLSVGSAVTDSQGRAQTVYTASSTTSANQGVRITATVPGVTPTLSDQVALTVARREVFVSIGTGNSILEPNTAQYDIEYVVQVTDSNGNGVPSVPVSVRLLSKQYFKGYRLNGANLTPAQTGWSTFYTLSNSTSLVGAGCTMKISTAMVSRSREISSTASDTGKLIHGCHRQNHGARSSRLLVP